MADNQALCTLKLWNEALLSIQRWRLTYLLVSCSVRNFLWSKTIICFKLPSASKNVKTCFYGCRWYSRMKPSIWSYYNGIYSKRMRIQDYFSCYFHVCVYMVYILIHCFYHWSFADRLLWCKAENQPKGIKSSLQSWKVTVSQTKDNKILSWYGVTSDRVGSYF